MAPNEPNQSQLSNDSAEKVTSHEDVKCLWERWDKTRQEEGPSDLVKGYNLVGVGMIIAGSVCQFLGTGILQYWVAPVLIIVGAGIIAVKKFRTLWLQRSLNS